MLAEVIVITVVDVEFRVCEIDAGEELVFFEDVIGNDALLRSWPGLKCLQLFKSRDEEGELSLEGGTCVAFVERFQEAVPLRFDHALRVHLRGDDLCQRTLAHPDGTFNSYVAGQFEKICHEVMQLQITTLHDWMQLGKRLKCFLR